MSRQDQKQKRSLKSKKYKALICDVDGTLLSKNIGKVPSEKVTQAIRKAQSTIHVGIATARPFFLIEHIVKHVGLKGPSIINGGAQIVHVETGKTIWEQTLLEKDLHEVFSIIKKLNIPFFMNDDGIDMQPSDSYIPKKPYSITTTRIPQKDAEALVEAVTHIPSISAHKFIWQEGFMGVSINHASATKQHAILEITKSLRIDTHEIIGVGDSYNDFPLLMACGLKIAMGNANNELKAIADYVAPSVDEDGVADIIERFILNKIQ